MKYLFPSLALATLLLSTTAMADTGSFSQKKAGDILLRGRAIMVAPSESATVETIGGEMNIDTSVVPELDLTYFLTDHIGVEVIAGVTPHNVKLYDSALGDLDLGSAWLLPPTVNVQYHFDPVSALGNASPYLGAGLNYTMFFGAGDWESAIGDVDYHSSFGGSLQAGVDVPLGNNWALNFDVKKIWITPDVEVTTATGTKVDANVDINPWVVGVGLGYKF